MKVVCWQSVLTEHQVHTLRALELRLGEPIEFVLGERELAERKNQGWTAADLSGLSVHDLPKRGWWQFGLNLLARYPDALHLFNGMWGDRRFFPLLVFAQLKGIRTGLISEPFADSAVSYFGGQRRWLDRLKSVLRPWAYRLAGSLLARRMVVVFAISSKAVAQFKAMGFKENRIFHFGYFVPAIAWDEAAQALRKTQLPIRLVFVGSLIERKGLPTLLKALDVCVSSGVKVTLDVFGPGSPPSFHTVAPCVQFRGSVPFGQTQVVVRNYDVLVLPSLHDGWGVVVNEALLQGVPVVVSSAVGARTLVEASGAGRVFDSGDVDSLVKIIIDLNQDPQLLRQWRLAAENFKPQLAPAVAADYLHCCLLHASGERAFRPKPPWYSELAPRQLHVVQDVSVRSGGLGLAALRYALAVAEAGAEVTLFVAERTSDELDYRVKAGQFDVVGPESNSRFGGLLGQAMAIRRCLNENRFDVVHLHGTWSPILAIASSMARSRGVPVIASPHGCLEPWALNHRRFKKQVALAVYQRHVFKTASMLVATAKQELESIRRAGLDGLVAVIPNGVEKIAEPKRTHDGVKRFLFLSRIHPKKGLHDLVMAWMKVRQPGWRVMIAGPSEGGYEDKIKSLIRQHGLEGDFDFPGLVSGEKKESCFAAADVFILPTYSENFGIAVAEALARGLPVITTTGAPWQELETHQCGWWVTPGVEGIAEALTSAMATPRTTLAEMGARGKKLVEGKYTWERIGRDALRASEWMVRREGVRPDFIDLS